MKSLKYIGDITQNRGDSSKRPVSTKLKACRIGVTPPQHYMIEEEGPKSCTVFLMISSEVFGSRKEMLDKTQQYCLFSQHHHFWEISILSSLHDHSAMKIGKPICLWSIYYRVQSINRYPNQHLLVESELWKHEIHMWNLFKIDSEDTKTMSMA